MGRVPRFDNAKIQRDLESRPLEATLLETTADVVKQGHAGPKAGS